MVRVQDQAFALSPGDSFKVPRGNTWSMHNASDTTEAALVLTIVRGPPGGGGGGSGVRA